MIGPSPSMPTMPSMIASDGRTAATMSRIDSGIPRTWKTSFGQP